MSTRAEIYTRIKELQAEGKDYDSIALTFALDVLMDIRDLLQKSEDRMVRMEADIASRLQS